MVFTKFINGTLSDANQINDNFSKMMTFNGINTIRQVISGSMMFSTGSLEGWGDAYIDADGRNNSVNTLLTAATFDTNKYKAITIPTVFVEITATSITSVLDFGINNCVCLPHEDSGKWLIYCTTGTDAVKRAQIYKTLFYGTDGTDPRISTTYVTGITSLKTSVTRDIGKKGFFAYGRHFNTAGTTTYTGSFTDTSTNANCSSWSWATTNGVSTFARWYLPSGTLLNQASNNTVDETGTDREADEYSNPVNCKLETTDASGSGDFRVRAIVLATGSLTWVNSGFTTVSNINFETEHGVPAMTAGSAISFNGYNSIYHNIPINTFSPTISKCIGVPMIANWESGADIQYKLIGAGSNNTGWLSCSNSPSLSAVTAFTGSATNLLVKLIPKTGSPTSGYPSIYGFWVYAE